MVLIYAALLILITQSAYAYVGPGLGAGAISVVLGIIGSIFLALFALIYYPVKRALKKWKAKHTATAEELKK
ncbi:MAG: hypothetical protein PVF53_22290 [Desulfobacterales bacterium]|jgi:hypothetical protein